MTLSVVIAAGPEPGGLEVCLQSIADAEGAPADEVIVVCAAGAERSRRTAERFPSVQVITAPHARSFLELRAAGLRAAGLRAPGGQAVAILSEAYAVDSAWLRAARDVSEMGDADVVCGSVASSDRAGLSEQAAYLWEYAHIAPPAPNGPLNREQARLIPAGNVVYRRRALAAGLADRMQAVVSELDLHAELHDRGVRFTRDPRLTARYQPPPLRRFLRDRYGWSLAWAKRRARRLSRLARLREALLRLGLMPLLLGRFAGRVARKPRYWLTAALASPLWLAFAAVETAAEIDAFLRGDAQ